MQVTATQFRQNVYKILDEVIAKGIPVEIKRKGVVVKITTDKSLTKLNNLKKRKILNSNPDDIVHMDWSSEWRG